MSQLSPIFIHSGFRVSSTWLWSKIRALPDVTAYYEIFHERLASVDHDGVDRFNTECWDSRHPHTAPYFREYLDLIAPGGGVRGYRQRMAYLDFVADGGLQAGLDSDTRDYVGGLIGHAHAQGRRPVLTCGRTLGRVAGLRRAFGGAHVLLLRDLSRQWASYLRLGNDGVWYFHNATLSVLANGRFNDAFLARLHDAHTQAELCRGDVTLLRFRSLGDYFRAFVGLHLYFYLAALRHVDLVLDVSAMAEDRAVLEAGMAGFAALTGIAPDLRDIRAEEAGADGLRLTAAEAAALLRDALGALDLGEDAREARWGAELLRPVTG